MRRSIIVFAIFMCAAVSGPGPAAAGREPRRMSLKVLEDKIRGGWAGQMIGVSYGAPTEFRARGKIIDGEIPWSPDRSRTPSTRTTSTWR